MSEIHITIIERDTERSAYSVGVAIDGENYEPAIINHIGFVEQLIDVDEEVPLEHRPAVEAAIRALEGLNEGLEIQRMMRQ
jgi:hypothetical protein